MHYRTDLHRAVVIDAANQFRRERAPRNEREAALGLAEAQYSAQREAHCSGPCRQGRIACPTPTICERAEDGLDCARGILVALAMVASIVAAVLLLHWMLA